jgi:hypothetical protein
MVNIAQQQIRQRFVPQYPGNSSTRRQLGQGGFFPQSW